MVGAEKTKGAGVECRPGAVFVGLEKQQERSVAVDWLAVVVKGESSQ